MLWRLIENNFSWTQILQSKHFFFVAMQLWDSICIHPGWTLIKPTSIHSILQLGWRILLVSGTRSACVTMCTISPMKGGQPLCSVWSLTAEVTFNLSEKFYGNGIMQCDAQRLRELEEVPGTMELKDTLLFGAVKSKSMHIFFSELAFSVNFVMIPPCSTSFVCSVLCLRFTHVVQQWIRRFYYLVMSILPLFGYARF